MSVLMNASEAFHICWIVQGLYEGYDLTSLRLAFRLYWKGMGNCIATYQSLLSSERRCGHHV